MQSESADGMRAAELYAALRALLKEATAGELYQTYVYLHMLVCARVRADQEESMTPYYDAYCQRWHAAVVTLSRGYARGLWATPTTPDALLLLYGPRLLDVLLSWYAEELFFEE